MLTVCPTLIFVAYRGPIVLDFAAGVASQGPSENVGRNAGSSSCNIKRPLEVPLEHPMDEHVPLKRRRARVSACMVSNTWLFRFTLARAVSFFALALLLLLVVWFRVNVANVSAVAAPQGSACDAVSQHGGSCMPTTRPHTLAGEVFVAAGQERHTYIRAGMYDFCCPFDGVIYVLALTPSCLCMQRKLR